ncbi:hypothetical protein CDAR_272081 [Caerostris darwini]|uniref:Uncharacterized protein n=1 Tax=Caerostris darwini TaxID=1538125 RepID=A0AAV4W110_9ARAC|nr:hypothetical protein CDAR_272081 [Caerostris darwini]
MKSGPVNTVEDIRGYRTFIIRRRHWDGKKDGYGQPFQRVPLHFFIRKSVRDFIFWKLKFSLLASPVAPWFIRSHHGHGTAFSRGSPPFQISSDLRSEFRSNEAK